MHTYSHTHKHSSKIVPQHLAKGTFKTEERIFTCDDVINVLINDIINQICKRLCLGQTENRNETQDVDGEKEVEIKGMARGPPL